MNGPYFVVPDHDLPEDYWDKARRDFRASIARSFDVPVWLVAGDARPKFFRLRWRLRRLTGWDGSSRKRSPNYRSLDEQRRLFDARYPQQEGTR